MKQKQNHFRLNRYTVGIPVSMLVLLTVSSAVIFMHRTTDAAPKPKTMTNASTASQFSFAGATGWWKGATNETSMALFSDDQSCFTSIQHKGGTVNVAAELQKGQTSLAGSGYTSTPSNTLTTTLRSNTGQLQYQLHQYSVATPAGASELEGGQEFGYLQLSSGYLEIQGYCNTAGELSTTIPALQAIKFDD